MMARAKERAGQRRKRSRVRVSSKAHDWPRLRREYVTGPTDDVTAFAKERGINRDVVSRRANREGWRDERAKHWEEVQAQARKRIARTQARTEAEINLRAHRIAWLALRRAEAKIRAVSETDEAKELKGAVDAARQAFALARMGAGLPEAPVPSTDEPGEGEIVMRRRAPDGSVVEVTIGSATPPAGAGPDGLHPNPDAVEVPAGHDEPGEGDDRGARKREDEDGG
jgi:hypothetical protein